MVSNYRDTGANKETETEMVFFETVRRGVYEMVRKKSLGSVFTTITFLGHVLLQEKTKRKTVASSLGLRR